MQGIARSLLSIILSLALLLAPVSSALGSWLSASNSSILSVGQHPATHSAMMVDAKEAVLGDTAMVKAEAAMADCRFCAGECCAQSVCDSASCGTCVTFLSQPYTSTLSAVSQSASGVALSVLVGRAADTLFRPPRS